MLATGVYVAFFLCLRSSEYVSKTVVPLANTHQFTSFLWRTHISLRRSFGEHTSVYGEHTLINSNQIGNYAYEDFKTVKFSLLQAKIIRNDFGVPIWFSTHDKAHQPIPFVLLIYKWSKHSLRLDADPFLCYRVRGHLFCLL